MGQAEADAGDTHEYVTPTYPQWFSALPANVRDCKDHQKRSDVVATGDEASFCTLQVESAKKENVQNLNQRIHQIRSIA